MQCFVLLPYNKSFTNIYDDDDDVAVCVSLSIVDLCSAES